VSEAHVVPRGDYVEHELSDDCVCGPTQEAVSGGWLIIHHALDGRREFPRDGRNLSPR
jgi:hypothetical protein